MKIKNLAAALVLYIAIASRLHSIGLGVQLNFGAGDIFTPGIALVVSPQDKTHIAVNWKIAEEVNSFGFTADYCPLAFPIPAFKQAPLNFTLGVGLFANMEYDKSGSNDYGIEGGVRAPVGINLMLFERFFELYIHVAPSFGVQFKPKLDLTNLFFPVAFGGRFWFR